MQIAATAQLTTIIASAALMALCAITSNTKIVSERVLEAGSESVEGNSDTVAT